MQPMAWLPRYVTISMEEKWLAKRAIQDGVLSLSKIQIERNKLFILNFQIST
jgi:hypothetical protein